MVVETATPSTAELLEREWLTVPEITRLTGMSRKAIERWIYGGELETRNPRATREIRTSSLLSLFELHGTAMRAPAADAPFAERLTLDMDEVSKATGVQRMTLYQRMHRGSLPHARLGGKVVLLTADLPLVRELK